MPFLDELNEAFPPGTETARDVLRTAHEVEIANAEAAAAADAEAKRIAAEEKLEQTKNDFARREAALQAANLSLALKVGVAPGVPTPDKAAEKPEITTMAEAVAKYTTNR